MEKKISKKDIKTTLKILDLIALNIKMILAKPESVIMVLDREKKYLKIKG